MTANLWVYWNHEQFSNIQDPIMSDGVKHAFLIGGTCLITGFVVSTMLRQLGVGVVPSALGTGLAVGLFVLIALRFSPWSPSREGGNT